MENDMCSTFNLLNLTVSRQLETGFDISFICMGESFLYNTEFNIEKIVCPV